MTNNQIQYWKLQHDKDVLLETNRHNLATEQVDKLKHEENVRMNKVTSGLTEQQLSETKRRNLATEQIDISKLAESARQANQTANVNMFKNTYEHLDRVANLHESGRQADQTASVNMFKNTYEHLDRAANLKETVRNHMAVEDLERTSNSIRQMVAEVDKAYKSAMASLKSSELALDYTIEKKKLSQQASQYSKDLAYRLKQLDDTRILNDSTRFRNVATGLMDVVDSFMDALPKIVPNGAGGSAIMSALS